MSLPCLVPFHGFLLIACKSDLNFSPRTTEPFTIYLLSTSLTSGGTSHGCPLCVSTADLFLHMLFCLPGTLISKSSSHGTSWAFFDYNSLSKNSLSPCHLVLFLGHIIWFFSLFSIHILALGELLL